jgi:phosphate transport system protein
MLKELIKLFSRESLLDQAYSDVITMLKDDQEMFDEAVRTLRRTDTSELRFDFREKDRKINKFEREVRKKVLTHLSIQQGFDVAAALIVTSIVHDVERIGDYCKNIAELALAYPKKLQLGIYEERYKKAEEVISERIRNTTKALENFDTAYAVKILEGHRGITKGCDQMLKKLINEKVKGFSAGEYAALALYTRYLKRTSAHLTNIASSIVNPFHRIGFKPKSSDSSEKK